MRTTVASHAIARPFDALFSYFGANPGTVSPELMAEFQALLKEKDPELLYEGFSSFASRLERAGQTESAARVYASLLEALPEEADVGLRRRVTDRFNCIQGVGDFGNRAEFLLGRFTQDAFNPKTIAPMIFGTSVFSLTRTLALGRFGSSTLFRAFDPRFAASCLGFAAEVPAFALSARALRPTTSQAPSIGQELAGAAITLGFLKTFGHGAQTAGAIPALRKTSRFQPQLLSQTAMFGGLMTAHKVEESLGLRPHVDGATTVTDTLASMFSLGIGTTLAHRALGPRYKALQGELNWRFKNYSIATKSEFDFSSAYSPRTPTMEKVSLGQLEKGIGIGNMEISLSQGGKSKGEIHADKDRVVADKLLQELADHPNPTAEMLLRAQRSIDRLLINEELYISRGETLAVVAKKLSLAEVEKLIEFAHSEDSWRTAHFAINAVRRSHFDPQVRKMVRRSLLESDEPFARIRKRLQSEGIPGVLPEIRQAIQEEKIDKALALAKEAFHYSLIENLGEKLSMEHLHHLEGLLKLPHAGIRMALYEVFDRFAAVRIASVENPSPDHPAYHIRALIRQSPEREKFLLREDFLSNDPIRICYAKDISDSMLRLSSKDNPWQK